ncbi:MAG: MerR family transcriptional regulator [Dactylosporangium sp.]|nr:MerR family transcriptional regulator [Dactylosporangium sp.]NNJ61135.1 MerR family transcriptional regulator [Dactylosporangium sp.]
MLTIGEIARLAGATVRAVRHYHAVGLLAEPERDANGYRRYGAVALVRLIRIRQLRDLGIPLSGIRIVIDTDESFAVTLADLDAELSDKIAELEQRRARIAALLGQRADPELPAPLADLMATVADRATASGSPVTRAESDREKEAILLVLALSPEILGDLTQVYRRLLGDAEVAARIAELDRRFADLAAEPADSPLIEELVDRIFADPYFVAELASTPPDQQVAELTLDMLREYLSSTYCPAQQRFVALVLARARAHLRHAGTHRT